MGREPLSEERVREILAFETWYANPDTGPYPGVTGATPSDVAALAREVLELREAVRLAAIRFDLMAGRFRGCDQAVKDGEKPLGHGVSIPECEAFAADYRALLAAAQGDTDG